MDQWLKMINAGGFKTNIPNPGVMNAKLKVNGKKTGKRKRSSNARNCDEMET